LGLGKQKALWILFKDGKGLFVWRTGKNQRKDTT